MCLKRVKTIEEEAELILQRKESLKDLQFPKKRAIDIAIYCFEKDPSLVKQLSVSVPKELDVLQKWVEKDPIRNYLQCLENKVDHVDLLTLYFNEKMQRTLTGNDEVSLITSYDKKLIINYKYETKKGETIAYFDNALGVPTALVATANVRFKLLDAEALVKKIDVDVAFLDMSIVSKFIISALNRAVRDTLLAMIVANKLSFYDLARYYTSINQAILAKLHKYFDECGLDTADFSISDISIPNNMGKLLQNQFFAIAEAERVKEYEQKMESASLDLYERKAEIHSKYPDFPITLTEAEKDFALNRYLSRMGVDTSLNADIKEEELDSRKETGNGTVTRRQKVTPYTFVKKSNKALITYLIVAAIMYIFAFCMFAVSVGSGLITLGVVTFAAGMWAFFGYRKLKYGKQVTKTVDDEPSSGE